MDCASTKTSVQSWSSNPRTEAEVEKVKLLGVWLDSRYEFTGHVNYQKIVTDFFLLSLLEESSGPTRPTLTIPKHQDEDEQVQEHLEKEEQALQRILISKLQSGTGTSSNLA